MGSDSLTTDSHPTVLETISRFWNNLPSLWKVLIPTLGALLIVLLPANLLISSRFYAITTENLGNQHRALLAEKGSAFDEMISRHTLYLVTLASSEKIVACAATACVQEGRAVFEPELAAKIREPGAYYTEIGFIDGSGKETARAIRGTGSAVVSPGDLPQFSADPAMLEKAGSGQVYVFPITRDVRLSAVEAYQQPVVRLAVPVEVAGEHKGYVTAVIGLDDFFAQNFVFSDEHHLFLLDTEGCLLASSEESRRAELYKTWSNDAGRTCYKDFPLENWDSTVQRYGDTILSTRVMHGALSTSGQTWTLVIQQPAALAYGQANALRSLLIGAHVITMVLVALLIVGADRATAQLIRAAQSRQIDHARDTRFNPYTVNSPIDDPRKFIGRTLPMVQALGAGVMGGDHVLIVGGRGIGKTSLLRQIERRLRDQKVPDPTYWYWPVALSAQGIPADAFYETLIAHILRDIPDHNTRADLHYHKGPTNYGIAEFREDITEVLDLSNPTGKQTRMVLCLDNLDSWFGSESGYDVSFIWLFRDMLRDVGTQLKLIATGTAIPEDAFGLATTVIRLGPLSEEEASRLIREPVAAYYRFEDDALQRILTYSDRLPREVQRFARYSVQTMLEQDAASVMDDHVERALQQAIADWEPTFRWLWYGGKGGADKTGTPNAPLNDDLKAVLMDCAANDKPIPAALTSMRGQLADITFMDAQGAVRLTSVCGAWLGRLGR